MKWDFTLFISMDNIFIICVNEVYASKFMYMQIKQLLLMLALELLVGLEIMLHSSKFQQELTVIYTSITFTYLNRFVLCIIITKINVKFTYISLY